MYLINILLSVFFALGYLTFQCVLQLLNLITRLSIPNSKCGVFQNQELFEHQPEIKVHEALFHVQYHSNILY